MKIFKMNMVTATIQLQTPSQANRVASDPNLRLLAGSPAAFLDSAAELARTLAKKRKIADPRKKTIAANLNHGKGCKLRASILVRRLANNDTPIPERKLYATISRFMSC
jgi:hypothetical protein